MSSTPWQAILRRSRIWSSLLLTFLHPMTPTELRCRHRSASTRRPWAVILVPPRSISVRNWWLDANISIPESSSLEHPRKFIFVIYRSSESFATPSFVMFLHSPRERTLSPRRPERARCWKIGSCWRLCRRDRGCWSLNWAGWGWLVVLASSTISSFKIGWLASYPWFRPSEEEMPWKSPLFYLMTLCMTCLTEESECPSLKAPVVVVPADWAGGGMPCWKSLTFCWN